MLYICPKCGGVCDMRTSVFDKSISVIRVCEYCQNFNYYNMSTKENNEKQRKKHGTHSLHNMRFPKLPDSRILCELLGIVYLCNDSTRKPKESMVQIRQ